MRERLIGCGKIFQIDFYLCSRPKSKILKTSPFLFLPLKAKFRFISTWRTYVTVPLNITKMFSKSILRIAVHYLFQKWQNLLSSQHFLQYLCLQLKEKICQYSIILIKSGMLFIVPSWRYLILMDLDKNRLIFLQIFHSLNHTKILNTNS